MATASLRDEFAATVAAGERTDLARAALVIARIAYPTLDPAPSLAQLDALAAAARRRIVPGASPAHAAREVAAFLFGDGGFAGNRADYYDPRNSFLNDVLERRLGIPITLATVLLEVGRRCGLRLEGVGFPGHFLVRVPDPAGAVLLDPFSGGRALADRDLVERWRSVTGVEHDAPPPLPPGALATTGVPGMLARMLRNLVRIWLEARELAPALAAVDLLLVLLPGAPAELRMRGLLYEQLECHGAALADLRRYLELVPQAPDAHEIRRHVATLERAAATVH
jgi:regulator of sirC expression with transglutaminase-like and TPR domain